MTEPSLEQKAAAYLRQLAVEIRDRRVGSVGNRAATDLFADAVASRGWQIECPTFECIDWRHEGADLAVAGEPYRAFPSPYSLGCHVRVPLAVVSNVEALEAAELARAVVLLRGEITREQLMPKNFPFYNPEHHQHIIHLLESKAPLAIVAATSRDPEMVGSGVYPFPLIEDGDFDIPSVYMTEEEGERLATHEGEEITLESRATRIPAQGCSVLARKGGDPQRRVVLCAHIDTRMGTPGANDNASGVIVLLLLAELLAGYGGPLGLELVAMNGEDYYATPGEQQYVALNEGRWEEIILGINLDDVGYVKGRAAYSLYDCPAQMADVIRSTFAGYPDIVEGEPWYQGDHGLFLINQRPALALTSEMLVELMGEITHTPKDTAEIVDPAKLVQVALALRELFGELG